MCRGEDTAYYLKRGFRVLAVEADPKLAAQCRQLFAEDVRRQRLTILEGAVAEGDSDQVCFHRNLDNDHWGTLCPDWVARNEGRGTRHDACWVARIDLPDCFRRYGVPYYLKIDLEGADLLGLRALRGLPQLPPYVSLESEMKSFAGLLEELRLLESLGYTSFRAVQQSNLARLSNRLALPVQHDFPYGCSGPLPEEWPGLWQDGRGVRRTYGWIFFLYRLLGTSSWLWKQPWGKRLIQRLGGLVGQEVPGWYDTHARHPGAGCMNRMRPFL